MKKIYYTQYFHTYDGVEQNGVVTIYIYHIVDNEMIMLESIDRNTDCNVEDEIPEALYDSNNFPDDVEFVLEEL